MARLTRELVLPLGGDLIGAVAGLVESAGDAADASLGTDIAVFTDLDPNFGLVSGPLNVAYAGARRLSCPAGWHADHFEGDADYGRALLDRLNRGSSLDELAATGPEIRAELLKDPRIVDAEVIAPFNLATSTLTPSIRLEFAAGPFEDILPVADLTVEQLRPKG